MTPFPYSVTLQTSISEAGKYMDEHQIHHLPVIDGEKIVGILSDKDFQQADAEHVSDISFKKLEIFDLNERLDNILEIMADKRLDTVLITKNGKLVGIFTESDACRHFASYLREEFGPHDGNTAA